MGKSLEAPLSPRALLSLLLLAASLLSATPSALATPPTPGTNERTSTRDSSLPMIMARQAPAATGSSSSSSSNTAATATPALGTVLSTAEACAQYSRVANLSAIGTNATIRSAFLQASPVGTLFNAALLNVMQADARLLSADVALNTACGNLSALATAAVGANFSQGIVGQFTFTGNPVSVVNGPIIVVMTLVCLLLILGPASAV